MGDVSYDYINDMVEGELYTRGWKLGGTEPPCTEKNRRITDAADLSLSYVVYNKYDVDDSIDYSNPVINSQLKDSSEDILQVEIFPPIEKILRRYYTYFTRCVVKSIDHYLVNICERNKKSFCVDIEQCMIIQPEYKVFISSLNPKIVLEGEFCILSIPYHVIKDIINALCILDIEVLPEIINFPDRATKSLNFRIRKSDLFALSSNYRPSWRDVSHLCIEGETIKCKAVATATFTVSFILSPFTDTEYITRVKKHLEVVIHSIK
jgi:hypothetical protein